MLQATYLGNKKIRKVVEGMVEGGIEGGRRSSNRWGAESAQFFTLGKNPYVASNIFGEKP